VTEAERPIMKTTWKRRLVRALVVLLILAVPLGAFAWYKFFRQVPQPEWITSDPEQNFLHGSIGAEANAGIPYWILVVLPRIFDDFLPGPGGYASLGLPWQEGTELPAGFSKKTVGFDRVGFNCALCHATQYRVEPDQAPTIVAAGGSNTADIQGLLEFFSRAANDSRFGAETLITQIDMAYPLSFLDRVLYKLVYIPLTRKRLREQGADFVWAAHLPRWGPGRDAPMNLTKFNFLRMPVDGSVDNTDFPSIWHLKTRVQAGRTWPAADDALAMDLTKAPVPPERLMLMNLDGATTSFRSVIIDSALGLQADGKSAFFRKRMADLEDWLMNLPPPRYPLPVDSALAGKGRAVFEERCAQCHASGRDNRLGTVIPLEEIGTDPERANAWTKAAADSANRAVRELFDIHRTPMGKPVPGYIALQLDGLWLRGPYLHNGSVPTVRALLEPPDQRPRTFYRGYDVLDRVDLGFISQRCGGDEAQLPGSAGTGVQWGCMPSGAGWFYDTAQRGNGSGGHLYGTDLPPALKTALVEYLKTF
jgi:RoxA-like, cytochrome c-like